MHAVNFHPNKITELEFSFPGRVFRSPMPFGSYPGSEAIYDQYIQKCVQVVVNLMPSEESHQKASLDLQQVYLEAGMQIIALPIQDFSVPVASQLSAAVDQVISLAGEGKNIVVHCSAGIGRTGTFLACIAVKALSLSGEQAISWVRQFIPHAVENDAQRDFVIRFGERHADHEC